MVVKYHGCKAEWDRYRVKDTDKVLWDVKERETIQSAPGKAV